MSILEDLSVLLKPLGLPFETGVYSKNAPDKYVVLLPLEDTFSLFGDNHPGARIEEARISIFAKGSYTDCKNSLFKALTDNDFTVTYAFYVGFETDTKYHHYNIDVSKYYETEE